MSFRCYGSRDPALYGETPLHYPPILKSKELFNRKLLIRSCKELLPSSLSLGSLGISSAAFGNYKPEKEEANYRDWSCTLLIMLLLPLGHANSPLSTGFSNMSSAFSMEAWHTFSAALHHFCYIATLEWYWVLLHRGSSRQFHGHTSSFGKATCAVVLWLNSRFAGIKPNYLAATLVLLNPAAFPTQLLTCFKIPDLRAAAVTSFISGFTVVGIFNVVNLEEYSGYRDKCGFVITVKFPSVPPPLLWTHSSVVPFFVIPLLVFSPVPFILWVKFEQYAES